MKACSYKSLLISSISGKTSRSILGSSLEVRKLATPIGLDVSRNESSTIFSLFDLQRTIPIDGFSSGNFTYSSKADKVVVTVHLYVILVADKGKITPESHDEVLDI